MKYNTYLKIIKKSLLFSFLIALFLTCSFLHADRDREEFDKEYKKNDFLDIHKSMIEDVLSKCKKELYENFQGKKEGNNTLQECLEKVKGKYSKENRTRAGEEVRFINFLVRNGKFLQKNEEERKVLCFLLQILP
jgi:hypothetical protein